MADFFLRSGAEDAAGMVRHAADAGDFWMDDLAKQAILGYSAAIFAFGSGFCPDAAFVQPDPLRSGADPAALFYL